MTEDTPQTTHGLAAKVSLRRAWFDAHPNQPLDEGRAQVDALIAAIEAEVEANARADEAESCNRHAAEAVAAERARITREVEAEVPHDLDCPATLDYDGHPNGPCACSRVAVLAIVNPEPKEDR